MRLFRVICFERYRQAAWTRIRNAFRLKAQATSTHINLASWIKSWLPHIVGEWLGNAIHGRGLDYAVRFADQCKGMLVPICCGAFSIQRVTSTRCKFAGSKHNHDAFELPKLPVVMFQSSSPLPHLTLTSKYRSLQTEATLAYSEQRFPQLWEVTCRIHSV